MAKKRTARFWIFILLLIILGAVAAYAIYKKSTKPKGVAVEYGEATKRTIDEQVSASGRIFPETEIKISSDVSGEIVELFIMEGDSVKAGQLLAKIDPESYVSTVQRGKAAVSGAKSQIALSRSQKESSIAQKEQILVQLKNAEKIHSRNNQLLTDGVISQADFDQSLANVDNLKANLKAAEASIRSAEESIKGAEYNVESAEATLKEFKTNLSRTTIKAPVSGIISSLSVEQGERVVGTIQMTGTEMMRIANLSSMEVQVDVSENDIVRVSLGDKVDIEVDAYLGETFSGTVTEIANSASNLTGAAGLVLNTDQVTNFIVKIRIDSDSYTALRKAGHKYPFRPGMSASVDIYTNKAEDVLTVPIQAVTARERDEEEGKKKEQLTDEDYKEIVFIASGDTVIMKEVKTGIQDDEYIQILSGLNRGDKIITGPYAAISSKLDEGDEIHEKKEEEEEDEK